jgi:hypothetical protein
MPDFNSNNYLREVKQTTTGSNQGTNCDGGFLVDFDVSDRFLVTTAVLSGSTGAYGSNSTSPLATGVVTLLSSTASFVSTGASTFGPFFIPRDYDQTSDNLQFRFLGSTAGTGQSTIALIGTIQVYSTGGSAAYTSPVSIASTTFNNGVWNSFGIAFNGNGLQYTDAYYLTLSTAGGNTQIAAASEVYPSCQVAWADYNNTQNVVTENVGTTIQQIRTT